MKSSMARAFASPLLLMGLIFVLSSIPGRVEEGMFRVLTDLGPTWQNLLHIPVFALVQYLWLRGFALNGKTGPATVALSFCLTLGYGAFDELHQYFVPGRYASFLDVLLDGGGAVLGAVGFGLFRKMSGHNPKNV
ncbi:MAG: VanZ family protein [Trichloromonas sp.]|jgi:glycopeptide antibiotics resistance protein|nr:VanZ family protein [Trichloromonas sp.]